MGLLKIGKYISSKFEGLAYWDEFIPLVVFNKEEFTTKNKAIKEPQFTEGVELANEIGEIPNEYNRVYTIVTDLDKITIPVLVREVRDSTCCDQNGVINIGWSKEVKGVTFEQESFETAIDNKFIVTITKTDPLLETEVDLKFLAKDNDAEYDNDGELSDLLCGVIKIKFEKKKIVYETLKIKVLDCRSNQIIPNAKVEKIVLNGAYSLTSEFNKEKFNKKLDKANDSNLIKKSQHSLDGLGFDTQTSNNNYEESYVENHLIAYNAYWESRFPQMVEAELIEKVELGNPPDDMLQFIIDEYNSNFSADEDGLIYLKIPKPLLDKVTNVEIGLKNFPILLEATNNDANSVVSRQTDVIGNGTGFNITWGDGVGTVNQSTDWGGNFGWRMREGSMDSEFKVSLDISIKDSDDSFNEFDKNLMSKFYTDNTSAYHLLFYAMQWSQPVWDGVEDPEPDSNSPVRSNDHSFINMKHEGRWVRGLNMHIPSKHTDGSGPYYGICAVTAPFPRGKKHEGVDLYSGVSGHDPAFAIHAGILKKHYGYGYGYRAYLLLGGVGDPCFHYAHLQSPITAKEWVKAGEIVGNSGRTYKKTKPYFSDNEPSHLHLEFIASAGSTTPAISGTKVSFSEIVNIAPSADKPYSAPIGENAFLFQGNRLPLLLPCKCHYRSMQTVSQCRVGNGSNNSYKTCYAIKRYPYNNGRLLAVTPSIISEDLNPDTGIIKYICPHILGSEASRKVQLQAKIKFIYINKDRFTPAIFPSNSDETDILDSLITITNLSIDGDIGSGTKSAIKELIRAHFYCDNSDKEDEERIIANDSTKISDAKILAFVNRYVDSVEISSDDDHYVIRDFYSWFTDESQVNFSNMCWNNSQ